MTSVAMGAMNSMRKTLKPNSIKKASTLNSQVDQEGWIGQEQLPKGDFWEPS